MQRYIASKDVCVDDPHYARACFNIVFIFYKDIGTLPELNIREINKKQFKYHTA